jgi:hypothetical protein
MGGCTVIRLQLRAVGGGAVCAVFGVMSARCQLVAFCLHNFGQFDVWHTAASQGKLCSLRSLFHIVISYMC